MPSRCQALDGNGKRCRRDATHMLNYHGESEMYFYSSDSVPSWVWVELCKQHAGQRGRKLRQKGGDRA